MLHGRLGARAERGGRRRARRWDAFGRSQAVGIKRLIALGGGIAQELFEARTGPFVGQFAFPGFVVLSCQQKAGEISDFRAFFFGQRLASIENFPGGFVHAIQ